MKITMSSSTDSRVPIYQQLRDQFAKNISEGRWKTTEPIPPETELARTLKVSLGTVRKGIQMLVDDGLLIRYRGRGTFITRPAFRDSMYRSFRRSPRSEQGSAEGYEPDEGQTTSGRVIDRKVTLPPEQIRDILRLRADQEAIQLVRISVSEGMPALFETIWLPFDRFEGLLEYDLADIVGLLYPIYEQCCGQLIASASETLMIDVATSEDAELGLKVGDPVVELIRVAYDYANEPIEYRRSRGAAQGFSYKVEIR